MPASINTLTRLLLVFALTFFTLAPGTAAADDPVPSFSRHITAVFSRLGCNGGTCHGAVQGKNGFRLSLFAADSETDYEHLVRGSRGRRIMVAAPASSLLLRKPLGVVPHGGGVVLEPNSLEYDLLYRWLAAGAPADTAADSEIRSLTVEPEAKTVAPGSSYQLQVTAEFADGTREDVTHLCSFESRNEFTASVDRNGLVTTHSVGDTALIVRYRAEPVMSLIVVPRDSAEPFPEVNPSNFIDQHILAKLQRLNLPPSELCDDATFLRRVTLDLAGRLPTPDEIRAFLADAKPTKREAKIDELLASEGHVDLWTMKFCDLLKASDYGVYADAIDTKTDALRFQAWVHARLKENLPYDEFAARILTATSREGRDLAEWQREVTALFEGYNKDRADLEVYADRRTPDLYWQRKNATGVSGALQIAHSFLGLRLECAQCHRHPHDVWQQDDLLSFANFFIRLRGSGFDGNREKQYPEVAKVYAALKAEGKQLEEEAKKLSGEANQLRDDIRKLEQQAGRLKGEINSLRERLEQAADDNVNDATRELADKERELDEMGSDLEAKQQRFDEIEEMKRRGKYLVEVGRRMMHAEIMHLGKEAADKYASVSSPLGTQESKTFRLLGESEAIEPEVVEDPRLRVAKWMRSPENPFFARAIVNRVWAHYFGRGIVDPPDDLSPLNPATHPELLDELSTKFIENGFDLRWLHRQIVTSRAYHRSSQSTKANGADSANYAYFYLRRLDGEIILDALDDATGSREDFGMKYWNWPDGLRTIEVPHAPEQNAFVSFMLEQFGRPERNSAIQCDCERVGDSSILQVLSLANHPKVWGKISDPQGRIPEIIAQHADPDRQIEEVFLSTVSRLPNEQELSASRHFVEESDSPEQGLGGVMWSLLNSKEFLLVH